jgi:glycosyltransferase involved in cell wall biosynthesis
VSEIALPFVSIVIPCRNEARWIARCLESVLRNDYSTDRLEVLVVDGMSDDDTRAVVERFLANHPCVRLLENPKRITPAALNIGITAARGDVIMRMDAHYEYGTDYISRLINWLQQSGADNVGGLLVMGPAADSAVARAIALGVVHPFGIGNAYYRIGATEPRLVDTVPFGCYRREVFDRIGLFDEDLVRNQDLEFNRRLTKSGGRILLVPDVVIQGHARDCLRKLWRMYYQYGYFNPLVIHKLGGHMTMRQGVTPLFVATLATLTVLAPWFWPARWLLAATLLAYGAPVVACSAAAAVRHGLRCGLALAAVFPTIHLSHGIGFLKGALDFWILRRNVTANAAAIPLSR